MLCYIVHNQEWNVYVLPHNYYESFISGHKAACYEEWELNTTSDRIRNLLGEEKTFSPDEVRKILNSDSQEIKKLCKQVCVSPKRDNTGKTFFLKNDVEILKKIKELHEKSEELMQQQASTALMVQDPIQEQVINSLTEIASLSDSIVSSKNEIIDRISKLIDEKLDGMDEVVVELIRSKTENERLKQKLNQLTKENFKLKNELESYRPVKFGLYMKIKPSSNQPNLF